MICVKKFGSWPAAHRVYNHEGHCSRIHGHNWSFEFQFEGTPDHRGFVVDFGSLGWLRKQLEDMFDHTLLVCLTDPELPTFRAEALRGIFKIVVLESVSSEGIARHLGNLFTGAFGKARLISVTVFENEANSATHICP